MRPADDAHWGQNATCPNMSHQHYDEDGGMYIEAMRDLKFIAGNAALQFLRGPMMSNMVKQGLIKQGQFYLSKLSEAQLRERMFFGAAIPCVRALNDRKSEDVIDRAGMCPPLAKAVNALRDAFHARMSKLTKTELRQMEASELTERLSALKVRAFDGEALARSSLRGPQRPRCPRRERCSRGGPSRCRRRRCRRLSRWLSAPLDIHMTCDSCVLCY
jgi:hypothetical protein